MTMLGSFGNITEMIVVISGFKYWRIRARSSRDGKLREIDATYSPREAERLVAKYRRSPRYIKESVTAKYFSSPEVPKLLNKLSEEINKTGNKRALASFTKIRDTFAKLNFESFMDLDLPKKIEDYLSSLGVKVEDTVVCPIKQIRPKPKLMSRILSDTGRGAAATKTFKVEGINYTFVSYNKTNIIKMTGQFGDTYYLVPEDILAKINY